ncbi:MAG TPA: oligosaccharide flippase family protein [Ignavibacteriales bacterium]|nr:oligosaccharide flippase family protein [Ignavibacteriales bacterium]
MVFSKITKNIWQKLSKSWDKQTHEGVIFSNMIKLVTGDSIARVIGLATAPIITRLYLPEHMGVLSVFTSLVALLIPFGTFRYSLAIPLPKSDSSALNISVLSFILLTISTLFLFFIFIFFGNEILVFFSMEQVTHYWWLVPITFAGTGLYDLLSGWAIRKKEFKPLAKTKVWQKIIGDVVKVLFGLIDIRPLGLLIGYILNQAGGILSLFKNFKIFFTDNVRCISRKRIIYFSKRYSDFPKYRIPSQFLLNLTAKAPLLYFAWHFGADTTGQIGLATMMLSLPISLIGYTTGKAYYAEIATIGKRMPEKIYKVTRNVSRKLFLFSIIPFSIILFFGPFIFKIVFGPKWNDAGVFASILSPYLLAQFIYGPISEGILSVFEKQSKVLVIEISRTIITFLVFLISFILKSKPIYTLLLYSIGLTLHYIFATIIVFLVIRRSKINNYII